MAEFIGYFMQNPAATICLFLGIALVTTEIFLPGFGVVGISGLVLLIVGIILKANSLLEALLLVLGSLVFVLAAAVVSARSAIRGRISRSPLVLQTSETTSEGYVAAEDLKHLVGRSGYARSTLRPSGVAEFDGARLDVVTEGGFLQSGQPVRIVRVAGARIVVEAVEPEGQSVSL